MTGPGPLMAFGQVDTQINKVPPGRGEDESGSWLTGLLRDPADPFAH